MMIFELDAMMASEGPPDGSTRLDSREALSAPTLAIPRSRILWRNTHTYNTHTCNTTVEDTVVQYKHQQYPHLQYHGRGYYGTIPTPTIPTLAIPRSGILWDAVKKITVLFGNFSQVADPPPFGNPLFEEKKYRLFCILGP